MDKLPPLGTKIHFWAKYVETWPEDYKKVWTAQPVSHCEGVIVGYRNLSNGTIRKESSDNDYGYSTNAIIKVWKQSSVTRAALVYWNLYRKPVFVPLTSFRVCKENSNG